MLPEKKVSTTQTFKFIGERLCLDFANTVDWHASTHPEEKLFNYVDIVDWGVQAKVITTNATSLRLQVERNPLEAQTAYQRATALRETIYRIFAAQAENIPPVLSDIDTLNEALSQLPAHFQISPLEAHYRCTWQPMEGLFDQVLGPVAWSAMTLLTSEELQCVKQCPNNGCGWLFLDTTKNHSRRWCEMAVCGSRTKAQRYYQKKSKHAKIKLN